MNTFDGKKYLIVFFITLGIFAVAFLLSEFIYNTRIAQVQTIESNIDRNILETEIQYELLADAACDNENGGDANAIQIAELNDLAKKLSYMEEERGTANAEVITLKKHYSLLQIKDYLLLKEKARRCGKREPTILYFYTNKGGCTDCTKEGFVLTELRENYPNLHVYAFDYHIGLTAIETLKSIYGLKEEFPIIVVDRKPYYGFRSRGEIEGLIPDLALMAKAASSTKPTQNRASSTVGGR